MSEETGPEFNWRSYAVQAVFAFGGAAIIAFAFVPFFAPGTDRVTAFGASLMFMVLTVAAAYTVKRP